MQNIFKHIRHFYETYATERNLYILVAVSLVIRVSFAVASNGSFNSAEDLKIAYNLVNSGEYVLHEHLGSTAMKSPLYPMSLACIIYMFGSVSELVIVIIQHIMIGCVPILIFRTAKKITDEKKSFFAAVLLLGHLSYFYYPNVIESTNLFIPLFALFIYQLVKSRESGGYIFLSIIAGFLVLLQPTVIPVLLMSAMFAYRGLGLSKIIQVVLIISLMQAPWIYRNYSTFDKFIPTKSPFWMNLYIGILPESQEEGTKSYLDASVIARIDSLKDAVNDVKMEKHYKEAFMSFWDTKSGLFPQKVLDHIKYYWYLPPRYIDHPDLSILAVRVLPNVILFVLLILGLKEAWKVNKSFTLLTLSILLYYTLIYSLTAAVNIRYKLDIEFLEIFIAMYALPYRDKVSE